MRHRCEDGMKVIEVHVVRISLGRVEARMAKECLERCRVATALTKEPVRESMPKLMRSRGPYVRSIANATNESPKRGVGRICTQEGVLQDP
jgi:hypothetical protein